MNEGSMFRHIGPQEVGGPTHSQELDDEFNFQAKKKLPFSIN